MKVAEFINKINEIGYDDNTELIFGTSNTNDFMKLNFQKFILENVLTMKIRI